MIRNLLYTLQKITNYCVVQIRNARGLFKIGLCYSASKENLIFLSYRISLSEFLKTIMLTFKNSCLTLLEIISFKRFFKFLIYLWSSRTWFFLKFKEMFTNIQLTNTVVEWCKQFLRFLRLARKRKWSTNYWKTNR
jgi:hypothetical protein